jgi:hypothetical protein
LNCKSAHLPLLLTLLFVMTALVLPACEASDASQSATPSSTSIQPAGQTQQTTSGSSQQGGRQDGQDIQKKLLARVAEILGVSSDALTAAYESAIKSVMGDRVPAGGTQGTPPSGSNPGTPPAPPSDNRTDGPGGQPGARGSFDMSGVYSKVAQSLGLTTEKVQAAFEQAQKELMPSRTK